MLVKDILNSKGRRVHTVLATSSIMEALSALNEHRIGALVVTNESGDIEGILTERDILRHIHLHGGLIGEWHVKQLMTPKEKLIVATETDDLDYVMQVMTRNRIRHLPVVAGDRLAGLVSIGDVVKCHLSNVEQQNKFLLDYVSGRYPA